MGPRKTSALQVQENGMAAMKTKAIKQKGRRLQQQVVEMIIANTEVEPSQIRSTPMGQLGPDIQMTEASRDLFPFAVECKAGGQMQEAYRALEQAERHQSGMPVVFAKADYQPAIVVMYASDWFDMCSRRVY